MSVPGRERDRTTMNSWKDPEFRAAVQRTGRKKLIIAGLWTEGCVAFPTLDALREGYEVYVVVDAIGGVSRIAHEAGIQRMIQAGATPDLRSRSRLRTAKGLGQSGAGWLRAIMREHFGRLKSIQQRHPA